MRVTGSYDSPTLLIPHGSPGSAKGSELLLISFIRVPGFQSLRITPGFYPGTTRPVKSVLMP